MPGLDSMVRLPEARGCTNKKTPVSEDRRGCDWFALKARSQNKNALDPNNRWRVPPSLLTGVT